MSDQPRAAKPAAKKPELADAYKALLKAEQDWKWVGEGAKRLLSTKPDRSSAGKAVASGTNQSKSRDN